MIYNPLRLSIIGSKYFDNYDNIKFRDDLSDLLSSALDMHLGISTYIDYIKTHTNITDLEIYIDKFPNNEYIELFKIAKTIEHKDNYIFIYDIKDKKLFDQFQEKNIEVISILKTSSDIVGCIFWKNKVNFNFYLISDLNFVKSQTNQFNLFITRSIIFEENKDILLNLQQMVTNATKELEENNKKLEKANEDLKGLDQLKDDLISISSHELRTPASIVKGNVYMAQSTIRSYIKTLPKGKKDNEYIEKLDRYIQRSIESIESEIRIINTLLEASRMGNSNVPILPENLDLVSMIESQVDGFKKEANIKGIKILYKKDNINMIYGDRTKVEEVLGNLISNAIKYSERGEVEISTEDNGEFVTVHVKDDGVGIPEEEIPNLFQKFHRLNNYVGNPNDPKDTKHLLVRPGGTGLGLYVVKGLVERMGGKIWLDSIVGKGSIFSFTIPVAKDIEEYDNSKFQTQDVFKKLKLK